MNSIGVIGDRDSVIGFRALGMTVLEAVDSAQAGRQLRTLVQENYAVIFITESYAEANQEYLQVLRSRKLPAVIPIPSLTGSTGLGMRTVRESVRKAVGMDLFGDDE
ncbi:MAG TPA: V-type ATP synthase subunit F [Clostridiales bacterium]|nr:V-type ATP synthase subunit F [Clostridiales bacterium]